MVKLAIQGTDFSESPLLPEESAIFNAQWNDMYMPPWSIERQLCNSRLPIVRKAVAAAKKYFEGKKFGGFNCHSGEIGISPIRPGHVGLAATTAAEGDNTWIWSAVTVAPAQATGFQNWIHSPTTATTAYAMHKDEFVYPFYATEASPSPIVQTIKMDVGRSDVLYLDVAAGRIRDPKAPGHSFYVLPNTFWAPETNVLVAIQCTKAGYMDLRLGGFTIAESEFLDATAYNVSTNTVATVTSAAT